MKLSRMITWTMGLGLGLCVSSSAWAGPSTRAGKSQRKAHVLAKRSGKQSRPSAGSNKLSPVARPRANAPRNNQLNPASRPRANAGRSNGLNPASRPRANAGRNKKYNPRSRPRANTGRNNWLNPASRPRANSSRVNPRSLPRRNRSQASKGLGTRRVRVVQAPRSSRSQRPSFPNTSRPNPSKARPNRSNARKNHAFSPNQRARRGVRRAKTVGIGRP